MAQQAAKSTPKTKKGHLQTTQTRSGVPRKGSKSTPDTFRTQHRPGAPQRVPAAPTKPLLWVRSNLANQAIYVHPSPRSSQNPRLGQVTKRALTNIFAIYKTCHSARYWNPSQKPLHNLKTNARSNGAKEKKECGDLTSCHEGRTGFIDFAACVLQLQLAGLGSAHDCTHKNYGAVRDHTRAKANEHLSRQSHLCCTQTDRPNQKNPFILATVRSPRPMYFSGAGPAV